MHFQNLQGKLNIICFSKVIIFKCCNDSYEDIIPSVCQEAPNEEHSTDIKITPVPNPEPLERHSKSRENNVETSEELVKTRENHVATHGNHTSTSERHSKTRENHVTSNQNQVTLNENHVASDENHVTPVAKQCPEQKIPAKNHIPKTSSSKVTFLY